MCYYLGHQDTIPSLVYPAGRSLYIPADSDGFCKAAVHGCGRCDCPARWVSWKRAVAPEIKAEMTPGFLGFRQAKFGGKFSKSL